MACKRSPVRSRYSPPGKDTTQKCVVSFLLHQTSEAFAPLGERRAWTARCHRDWNGPVFSARTRHHTLCGVFFVCTKRVRHLFHWESAVHGRQPAVSGKETAKMFRSTKAACFHSCSSARRLLHYSHTRYAILFQGLPHHSPAGPGFFVCPPAARATLQMSPFVHKITKKSRNAGA